MPKVRFKILPREVDESKKLNNSLNFSELLLHHPFNLDFHSVPNIKMEVDNVDLAETNADKSTPSSSSLSANTTNHNHHNNCTNMNTTTTTTSNNLKKIFFPNFTPILNRPLKIHFKFSGCRPTAERNRNSSNATNLNSNYNRSGIVVSSGGSNGAGGGGNSSSISSIASTSNGGNSSSSSSNQHLHQHHHHHNIFHNNFNNNNSSCNINHYGSNINNINSNNCNNVNDNFKRKIVVAHGKLLKPLSDRKKFVNLSDYCFVQI